MESNFSPLAVGVALVLAIVTPVLWAYLSQAQRYAKARGIPPGPPPKPIVGNLFDIPSKQRFEDWCLEQEKIYGDVVSVWLGRQLLVVVSSLEVQKEVLQKQDREFGSRPTSMPLRVHSTLSDRSIFLSEYGDYWRDVRKVSTLHLLSGKKVQALAADRDVESRLFCSALAAEAEKHGGVAGARPHIQRNNLNGAMKAIFSLRFAAPGFEGWDPTMADLEDSIFQSFLLMSGVDFGHAVPLLSLSSWTHNVKCRRVTRKRDRLLKGLLQEKQKRMTSEGASWQPQDVADVYLSMASKQNWSLNDILAVLLDLLNASVDTSTVSMEWLLAEITARPEIQKKVHSELDAVVGRSRWVTEEDIPKLPYLRAVVSEHFRYRQAGAFLGPHVTETGSTLKGYSIPPGTQVMVHTLAVARDPSVWKDANEFRPERFIEEGEVDLFGRDFRILPFGSGRRACPGMQLGLSTVQILFARALQAFKWDPPVEGQPIDRTPGDFGFQVGLAVPLVAKVTSQLQLGL